MMSRAFSFSDFDDDYYQDPTPRVLAEEFVRNCVSLDTSSDEYWEVYLFIVQNSDHCEQLNFFNRKILKHNDPATVPEFKNWFEDMATLYAEQKFKVNR